MDTESRKSAELELLHEFNQRLAGESEQRGVLALLAELGQRLVECDSFVIFLEEKGELRPSVLHTPHAERVENAGLMGLSEPIIEESWERKKALQLSNKTGRGTIFEDEISAATFLIGERGLLYLGKRAGDGFPANTSRLLTTLTRQAGLSLLSVERLAESLQAVESQRSALAQLEAWTEGLEKVSEGSRVLASTLSREEILSKFQELVLSLLPASAHALYELEKGEWCQLGGREAPPELLAHALTLTRPLTLSDLTQTRLVPLCPGHRSLLLVPMIQEARVQGVLALSGDSAGVFDRLHSRLAALLAQQFQASWRAAEMHAQVLEAYQKLEESEASLVQASKLAAVGQLAAGVAHELNTPLATILLEVEFLEMELDPDPETSASFEKMTSELLRTQAIVEKLLYYSRDARKGDKMVELNQVVSDTLGLVDSQLGLAGIDIQVRLADEDLPLLGNANEIQQILLNLLINTRDALENQSPATVALQTWRAQDQVGFTLADNGPGVEPETAAKIFDPFFTTKPVGKGTGLGLAISRRLAERHGGTLELRPAPVGATFQLTLPRKEPVTA